MMQKKTFSKKIRAFPAKQSKHFHNEKNEVVSLISKLEKKTEKQLSSFVKELVKLKKQQVKLEQKLTREKVSSVKTNKIAQKAPKRKNFRKFRIVENKPFQA